MALFSSAYWAPILYYQIAAQSDFVQIEQHEFYQKQSYRNRCLILSANGPLALTVPVLRPHQAPIRDIRIDYSVPWRQRHRRAIEAAYRSSAYFEEYYEDIDTLYQNEVPFLFDLNLQSWNIGLKLLGCSFPWELSDAFEPTDNVGGDYRNEMHPKKKRKPEWPALKPYFQVFANKFGFTSDLCILDLLFNKGGLN